MDDISATESIDWGQGWMSLCSHRLCIFYTDCRSSKQEALPQLLQVQKIECHQFSSEKLVAFTEHKRGPNMDLWTTVSCCYRKHYPKDTDCVSVLSSSVVMGKREVKRNHEEHPGWVLPKGHQPAASHLPLQTPLQLLQGPTRGWKPACPKHVSTSRTSLFTLRQLNIERCINDPFLLRLKRAETFLVSRDQARDVASGKSHSHSQPSIIHVLHSVIHSGPLWSEAAVIFGVMAAMSF